MNVFTSITESTCKEFFVPVLSASQAVTFLKVPARLPQQLIKNNVFPNFSQEKTFLDSVERKIQEQFLALELEKQMSKEEILENYMNTINLGQNTLGVQSAAKRYFNKDVSQLTLSECTVIAGITQNPGRYDPTVTRKKMPSGANLFSATC